jgi:D-aminoacyl-tRNA deacylase
MAYWSRTRCKAAAVCYTWHLSKEAIMKAVIQSVSEASVEVDGAVAGAIGKGLLVLLGVEKGDGEADASYLARKISTLRIFSDDAGKMNLALGDVGGQVLVVSQFTLAADTRKGNRPAFDRAAPPEEGQRLYGAFVSNLAAAGVNVATGVFGAHMKVCLVNDGPVTIILDSAQRGASV